MNAFVSNGERDQNENEHNNDQNEIPSIPTQEKLALSSWGLPEKVLQHYTRKGITHMFSWQLECLTTGKVLEGGNLVYSAPTSAGKTLVAEILIAQTVFEKQKKVILILPFVSVVREKMFYFQDMFSQNGIRVEGFMGGHSPSSGFKQVHMAVCTIEKANSIINRLLEEKNLNSLGLVVVDELHLLGDPYRGYLLELLLTKLKYMSSKIETDIQIVGMSATLPNLKVIADWLNADAYYSCFRPIPLNETLKCGNCLYDKKLNKLRDIVPIPSDIPDCPDHIGQLCLETIRNGHSVLIFCPSKAWCENLADEIALFFKRHGFSKSAAIENTFGWIIRNQINLEKTNEIAQHLKMTPSGLDNDLRRVISYGVAFHHAGLTLEERDIIEGSFRNGSIRVLCATSTLSSGVNLPARKVIIRSPMTFGNVMDVLTYRQMIGRAGRMGVDSEGESILICKPNEKIVCQQLMSSNLKPIESCLGRGTLSSSLKRALLEVVASGVASSPGEVKEYANCTFLASSSKHNIENPLNSCIKFLEENEFIRLQENGEIYSATPLGRACLVSSMPPDEGLSLFRELQRARRCFVLDTDLHIIYQVTPYSVSEQLTKLDWLHVLTVLENLPENMKRVGEMVGVEEQFLVRVVKNTLNPNMMENRIKLSIHRRFYTALALQDLINEVPLTEVAKKFQCNKGTLQSLQQSAATYAGMVTEFTRKLGWSCVELIFSHFQERLQFGVQRDLCELMRLSLLNVVRARAIFNAGYTNLVSIANANASDLENALYSAVPFQTKKEIDGETSFEREERNKQQTVWITGRADLSIRKAAELLIDQARDILKLELGVKDAQWGNCLDESHESDDSVPQNVTIKGKCDASVDNLLISRERICGSTERFDNVTLTDSSLLKNDVNKSWMVESNECNFSSIKCDIIKDEEINIVNNFDSTHIIPVNPNENIFTCSEPSCTPGNGEPENFNVENTTWNNFDSFYLRGKNSTGKEENRYISNSQTSDDTSNFSKVVINCKKAEIVEKNGTIDESDCCSTSSESSVEILYESTNVSITYQTQRISDDMFALQETEVGNGIDADIKTNFSGMRDNKMSIENPGDLFSQSLTFDTQLQRLVDDDGSGSNEPEVPTKTSTSFNSDDLGFVSDMSPQKLNQTTVGILNGKESLKITNKHDSCNNEAQHSQRVIEIKNLDELKFSSPVIVEDKQESALHERQSLTLKRKTCLSNSPDFIVGSDDSYVEEGHVKKKLRTGSLRSSNSSHSNVVDKSKLIPVLDESDTEIMPTPNTKKDSSLNNLGRIRNNSLLSRKRKLLHTKTLPAKRIFHERKTLRDEKNVKGTVVDFMSKTNAPTSIKDFVAERCELTKISMKTNSFLMKVHWDKIDMIELSGDEDLQSFSEELKLRNIIGLAIGCRRALPERKKSIASKIIKNKTDKKSESLSYFVYKDIVLDGMAVYLKGNSVFYLSFNDCGKNISKKVALFKEISHQNKVFRMFDAKEQIKLMHHFLNIIIEGSHQDPKTAHWLLSKIWKDKSFTSIVLDHIPESTRLISQLGPLMGFSGPGAYTKSSVPPKTRACLEAFLTFHVMERQLKLLQGKSLLKLFQDVEMPLVPCLAELDLVGFHFDRQKLMSIKDKLDSVQFKLSEKAYFFARYKFSLSSSAAISKLLYSDLKLGKSYSFVNKGNRRPSTKKEALEELVIETNHPLPDIILNWRKVQSVLSKVISPLLQIPPEVSRLFPVTQTHTATGRLAMQEPNLQNIPRNFSVGDDEPDISVREMFVPSEGCTLLSVDYCQIELRLLAHLSGDEKLIENIKSSSDVFVGIASSIFDVSKNKVDDELRQKTKKICYGIIYGIGQRALSHEMRVDESVAVDLMDDFKTKFKGVGKYFEDTLKECRKKGYVTSLLGRRRYLPYINDSNAVVKSKAERQAINTAIQGSAADLLKTAMVKIRKKIKDLNKENVTLRLILHLHDELLFEVNHDCLEYVAGVLKEAMENVISLKVSTPVKLHAGSSWGQLHLYEV